MSLERTVMKIFIAVMMTSMLALCSLSAVHAKGHIPLESKLPPVTNAAVNSNNSLTRELRAYWPMNEGAGVTVKDVVGSHHGYSDKADAHPWQATLFGHTFVLNHPDQRIDCGTQDDILVVNKPLTITAWIYARTPGGNDAGRIIGKERADGRGLRFYLSSYQGMFSLQFTVSGATDLDVVMTHGFLQLNQWSHVAVTYDGSSSASGAHIYLNGQEHAYKYTTQNGNGLFKNDGRPVMIGNRGDLTRVFDGGITNLKVWGRVLSQAELADDYSSPWGMFHNQKTE